MYSPEDDFDETLEMERYYAKRLRKQRIWQVLAVIVAVSLLFLYILSNFFRLGGGSRTPDTEPELITMAALVPEPF